MTLEDFDGWYHYDVLLLDGGRLVCFYFRNGAKVVATYDINHNIFRLDKDGNVVWQIQRDENGLLNWESLHRQARERGEDGARWPFERLSLSYSDGTDNHSPKDGNPPAVAVWVPGCEVWSISAQGFPYKIDIERGIARNMADGPIRPW